MKASNINGYAPHLATIRKIQPKFICYHRCFCLQRTDFVELYNHSRSYLFHLSALIIIILTVTTRVKTPPHCDAPLEYYAPTLSPKTHVSPANLLARNRADTALALEVRVRVAQGHVLIKT